MSKLDNLLWKFLTGTWTNNHKLDELQKADMQKVLAKVGLYTTCVLLPILTLVGMLYDGLHQQLSFSTLLLFGLLSINCVILYFSIRKNNVFDMEVETQEEHAVALQQLKRQMMKKGMVFFIIMLLWNNVVMRLLFNEPLLEANSLVRGVLGALVGTLLFVIISYYVMRDKIKRTSLED